MRVLLRSEYFKRAEAFRTATHNTRKVFVVIECPHNVLEAVINLMYGIDLSGTYSTANVESLLTMADLYLMDDLKDAVASHMTPHLDKDNIMDIYHLAEKYTARKLKEMCNDFIVTCVSIAKEVLGVDASNISKTKTGGSKAIKKDMIVRCNTTAIWWIDSGTDISRTVRQRFCEEVTVEAGTVGRMLDAGNVKWNSVDYGFYSRRSRERVHVRGDISHLDILTPPIHTKLFKD